ncbi:MAG: hypothetical protein AVDCRST_MAG32-1956 [uncultured Nocardioides sp.]|uniref:Uncharacterized protein n=1 Tax=uncultured Nocardioides sp. TaxID=198441 RepID=A0A6J4NHT3_9ACTN|nr:MAG: hypothetical protein AVDCRST_MAG32-1956 [uncultured Nocardioides sp.]
MHAARRTTTVLATAALATTLLGGGLLATPAGAWSAAAPRVDLEPAALTRGPDIAVPHVEGDDLVVGERRTDLPGARARLLGASGDAHVVSTSRQDGRRGRVLRVGADGSLTTLVAESTDIDVQLSEDGSRLVTTSYESRRASTIGVLSATTGEQLASRAFAGYPAVLSAKGGRVLLSTERRGVFWWSTGSGRLRTVTLRTAGLANITHDLLTTYTDDPYQDGCTLLTRLSRPNRVIWRSCTDRVDAFSPDGTRIATVDILSDGIGPGRVTHREVDGTRLATYESTGWFGAFSWESPSTLLLDTYGRRKSAVVRCTLAACENATDPVRTEPLPG